jgi:rRNA maturation endonuclease Nob1
MNWDIAFAILVGLLAAAVIVTMIFETRIFEDTPGVLRCAKCKFDFDWPHGKPKFCPNCGRRNANG